MNLNLDLDLDVDLDLDLDFGNKKVYEIENIKDSTIYIREIQD